MYITTEVLIKSVNLNLNELHGRHAYFIVVCLSKWWSAYNGLFV